MTVKDDASARPADHVWCLLCRGFRRYRNIEVPRTSRHHADGFDTDYGEKS